MSSGLAYIFEGVGLAVRHHGGSYLWLDQQFLDGDRWWHYMDVFRGMMVGARTISVEGAWGLQRGCKYYRK